MSNPNLFKPGQTVFCIETIRNACIFQGDKCTIKAVIEEDNETFLSFLEFPGNWYAYRFVPVSENISPQQKLDQLKKYFESGNGISVDRATIKASDFWAIYNS